MHEHQKIMLGCSNLRWCLEKFEFLVPTCAVHVWNLSFPGMQGQKHVLEGKMQMWTQPRTSAFFWGEALATLALPLPPPIIVEAHEGSMWTLVLSPRTTRRGDGVRVIM